MGLLMCDGSKGYDVHVLAQRGLDTLGIDLSETAVEQARRCVGV